MKIKRKFDTKKRQRLKRDQV